VYADLYAGTDRSYAACAEERTLKVPKVMKVVFGARYVVWMLLCRQEVVKGGICLLEVLGPMGDALRAAQYGGRCGGYVGFSLGGFEGFIVAVFSLQCVCSSGMQVHLLGSLGPAVL